MTRCRSRMRIAAYQAPLSAAGSLEALSLIRPRVEQCEAAGVAILCCPEAILGGLADYLEDPGLIAILSARIEAVLAPFELRRRRDNRRLH